MNHVKALRRTTGSARLVPRALLVLLTVTSVLAADQALARRGKGGLPPGIQLVPAAQPAAVRAAALAAVPAAVPGAALPQPVIKPILHHGRHGSKPRAGSR